MINGIPTERIDEMRMRLIGVDHRPWALSPLTNLDGEGRRMVIKASRKALKKAIVAGSRSAEQITGNIITRETPDDEVVFDRAAIQRSLTLFHRTDQATDDMLDFVAHAPEDVEELIREVDTLKMMVQKLKEERDQAVNDLLGRRIAADRAEAKIVDMRRAWRTLCKEMGTKP